MADLNKVRVRAFIDEPELGALEPNQAVKITWDALPSRSWVGRTEILPKQVVPHQNRSVGELLCAVNNDKLELLPNINVNVRINSRERIGVLSVPRGAVAAEGGRRYVFVVKQNELGVGKSTLEKREIHVGIAEGTNQEGGLEAGLRAYEASDYARAIRALQAAAAKDPQNGDVQLLLAKSYLELQQHDPAIKSAEKAVAIDPQNSAYHEWLGRAYGEKADHAGWFSAISLAKKTRREFETAVQLDARNYSARQALIEFDFNHSVIVWGGEEKALPHIKQLAEMDAAEGHYAAGNCRRQKKDFAVTDEEFAKALEGHPKSAERM